MPYKNPEDYKRWAQTESGKTSLNKSQKRFRKAKPERIKEIHRASRLRLLEEKAGRACPNVCDVCGRIGKVHPRTGKPVLHFDHDHATNEFRGWLCFNCNAALGHVNDNTKTLEKLIEYVNNSKRLRIA